MIKSIPLVGNVVIALKRLMFPATTTFVGSKKYWEERYVKGGTSGEGSYGPFAEFKAEVLNAFVSENKIKSVIEFGCGDGHQLTLASYPQYIGFDVSHSAVERCRNRFESDASKTFFLVDAYQQQQAELVLSLDVLYHLVEDQVFDDYMKRLFEASSRYVAIYSTNCHETRTNRPVHEKNRKFTDWIAQHAPEFSKMKHIPSRYSEKIEHPVDFYFFEKLKRAH